MHVISIYSIDQELLIKRYSINWLAHASKEYGLRFDYVFLDDRLTPVVKFPDEDKYIMFAMRYCK